MDIFMHEVYECVTPYIPIGDSCAVAYNLRELGIRTTAYPFDWSKIKIKQLINILDCDFKDYCKLEIVKFSENHESSYIITNPYKITMAHEVLKSCELTIFRDKLKDRIDKFREAIKNRVKFIRLETCPWKQSYQEDLNKLLQILDKLSPNYELILILHDSYRDKLIFHSKIKIIYYDDFNSDWKYPNINWYNIT